MSQHGAFEWVSRGFSFAGWGLVGSPGFFRNSGEYAIQMIIFGSLAIAFVSSLKDYWGRYKKWFLYLATATGYMSVMGASSRGAQLALAFIGVWFLLKQKWGFKGLAVVLVLSAALYVILPDEQIMRFHDIGSDTDSLQRLAYWQYGISEVIPRHPVLGVGYHNWLEYVSFKVPEGLGPYQIVQEPHNIYIQAAAELGFVGFSIFILLVIYAFILNAQTRAIANKSKNNFLYSLSFGLDAGLIGYLVAGSFVSVLYYPFFWVQLSMIVMVNAVTARQSSTIFNNTINNDPRRGRR
jgi:O-antigen ligase